MGDLGLALTSRLLGVTQRYSARIPASWAFQNQNIENSENPSGFHEIFNFHRFFVLLSMFGRFGDVPMGSDGSVSL